MQAPRKLCPNLRQRGCDSQAMRGSLSLHRAWCWRTADASVVPTCSLCICCGLHALQFRRAVQTQSLRRVAYRWRLTRRLHHMDAVQVAELQRLPLFAACPLLEIDRTYRLG